MSQSPPGRDALLAAEELLGDLAARAAAGQRADFESLVRAHPSLEPDLRALHGAGVDVDGALGEGRTDHEAELARVKSILSDLDSARDSRDRYTLESEIGKGGMGVVYRVRDTKLDRPLAMKVILGQADVTRTGKTPPIPARQLARFVNEAKITGQLDHPGIVPVHEVGVDQEGRAFFTMKLVKGITLAEVFDRRAASDPEWSMPRVLNVIQRVCEAMAFAHERGVIHRDLKPQNIMVGDFGEVYVMDWGLARRVGEATDESESEFASAPADVDAQLLEHMSLTRDGTIVGTPSYMSPEQARGQIAAMGPPSDVYALGAMLYQLIAGHAPYTRPGDKSSGAQILARVVTSEPAKLVSRTTPPELIAICEKAMSREPRARYANLRELAEDLGRFLSGRSVRALKTGTWIETKKWVQRNKALAGSLAGGLLALVAGIVVSTMKTREVEAANTQLSAETKRANEKTNDVLSLSSQKDLDDLVAEAAKLWPAHPEMLPAYEGWLRHANELIDGRPEAPGQKRRPSLAEHKAKLEELRREAKPLSEEEIRAERESHPEYADLQSKQAELLWRSRMLGLEPWPSEASVETELAAESLPPDADALNSQARRLVDPAKPVYGQEVRALLLAQRAVAAAAEDKRSESRDTLAWALFRAGRLDKALEEERAALSEPGGDALKSSAQDLEKAVSAWRGDEVVKRQEEREKLAEEVSALSAAVNERRTHEYADPEKAWWDRSLSKLVADLEKLHDPKTGLMNDVLAKPFGWGVRKRYGFAQTIGDGSVDGPEAKRLWAEAIAAIRASPKYGGLVIESQMGLLPIGEDRESHLWEFAHLQTGDRAVRDADGKLVLTEETGLVFVLIPGGTFWMGAQNKPDAQNHDPQARSDESPVHEVELSPYFLSKYEMTQGQWQRIAGVNPSYYKPPSDWAPSLLHPVEQVSWTMCFELLESLGLLLPSEAQWECGARGGTSTPWWTGQDLESLRDRVNIADKSFVKAGAAAAQAAEFPDLDDGSAVHCAVGKYAANGFGLHEVAGNVWEWCLDGYDSAFYRKKAGKDPLSPWAGSAARVYRGGSFSNPASFVRSAPFNAANPAYQGDTLGLRPSRALRLSPSPLHPPK